MNRRGSISRDGAASIRIDTQSLPDGEWQLKLVVTLDNGEIVESVNSISILNQ